MTYKEEYRLSTMQIGLFILFILVIFGFASVRSQVSFWEMNDFWMLMAGLLIVGAVAWWTGYFQTASLEVTDDFIEFREKKGTERILLKEFLNKIERVTMSRYHVNRYADYVEVINSSSDDPAGQDRESYKFGMNSQKLEVKPWVPSFLFFHDKGVLIFWKNKTKKTFIPSVNPEKLLEALRVNVA